MLQFLFFSIIFLIFVIILLLILPYHYILSFHYQEKLSYSFSFSVIFVKIIFEGNLNKQSLFFKLFNFKKEMQFNENKVGKFIQNKSSKIIKEKTKKCFNFDFSLINRENLNHIFGFVIRILKILKMNYLKLNLVFSFADPYYNGIFLAYYYTLKELFDYPNFKVRINWEKKIFEVDGSTGGKIIPAKIIFEILKFLFTIKSLKIFWKVYQSNSKGG